MANQRCKGARDFLPEHTERFRHIEDTFQSSCLRWGYQEVKTPTLEYLHLFTSAGTLTPNMLHKVYSFLDWDGWSGERVVLRPDGTIPIARLYVENLTRQKIARLFYVTSVFAFEETGKENREQWQCGVELIGDAKPMSDVEIILLAVEILHGLGINDVEIQLSHTGMLKALLRELKLSYDEEARLLTQVLDGNWQALTETKSANSNANGLLSSLLDLKGKSSSFIENLKALPHISSDLESELDNFSEIASLLDALDCNYQINITSTRGFEYYTGLCFQFLAKGNKIGSGGRYNDLIPLIGNENTPACGFALYINPLMDLVYPKVGQNMEHRILLKGETTMPDTIKSCFQLAQSLHKAGYIAELDFNNRQSDWRWVITVQGKPPSFVIFDQSQKQKRQAYSIDEVIAMLGGPV